MALVIALIVARPPARLPGAARSARCSWDCVRRPCRGRSAATTVATGFGAGDGPHRHRDRRWRSSWAGPSPEPRRGADQRGLPLPPRPEASAYLSMWGSGCVRSIPVFFDTVFSCSCPCPRHVRARSSVLGVYLRHGGLLRLAPHDPRVTRRSTWPTGSLGAWTAGPSTHVSPGGVLPARRRRGCCGCSTTALSTSGIVTCRYPTYPGSARTGTCSGPVMLAVLAACCRCSAAESGSLISGFSTPWSCPSRLGRPARARRALAAFGFVAAPRVMLRELAHRSRRWPSRAPACSTTSSCPCAWGACMDVGGRFAGTFSGSMNMPWATSAASSRPSSSATSSTRPGAGTSRSGSRRGSTCGRPVLAGPGSGDVRWIGGGTLGAVVDDDSRLLAAASRTIGAALSDRPTPVAAWTITAAVVGTVGLKADRCALSVLVPLRLPHWRDRSAHEGSGGGPSRSTPPDPCSLPANRGAATARAAAASGATASRWPRRRS